MSMLMLYRPTEGDGPPPSEGTPLRTLLGVGLVIALLLGGLS